MALMSPPPIGSLVRHRADGHTLPADLYRRTDVFEADCEVFFERLWVLIGVEADVPKPGDVFVEDIGRASVIVARAEDGSLSAFHNVCRHRGARLRECGKGSAKRIVCPYHRWTYRLNGVLMRAPHMGRDFDASDGGLRRVHVRNVGGLLFVCLAEEPPKDFADLEAAMAPRLAPFDLARAKIAIETEIVEDGNWKLTIENNRECYHCAGAHPELTNTFLPQDFGYDPAELSPDERAEFEAHRAEFARRTDAWEKAGLPSRGIDHLSGNVTNFRTERLMMGPGGRARSATMTGEPACRVRLGDLSSVDVGDLHLWTHQSWHHYMADHAVVSTIFPLDAGRTRVRTLWLVNERAVEGVDYDLKALTEVWSATNAQDAALVALAHKGARSPGYQPGPYSQFTERHLDDFAKWYGERMVAAGY